MRETLRLLGRRRTRTALTAIGLGLATALVVMLLALSAGIESSAAGLAQTSGVDILVTSGNTSLSGTAFPPVAGAHAWSSRLRSVDPNVETASPWLVGSLAFANASLYASVRAAPNGSAVPPGWAPAPSGAVGWIPDENAGIQTPRVTEGTGLTIAGDPHYANGTYSGPDFRQVVLDGGLASLLHVGPGATVWVASGTPSGPGALANWFQGATAFRVVGVSGPFWLIPSALLAFFYLSDLQQLTGSAGSGLDYASLILVHLHQPASASADRERLASLYPGLTFFTIGQVLGAVQQVIDLYRTFGYLIGAIAIVVAALFAAAVLLFSVDDRRRAIAVERAIGVRPSAVAGSVLEESLWLALFGFAIGLPLGYAGAWGVNAFLTRIVSSLPAGFSFVAFTPDVLASAVAEVVLIALFAAVLPAVYALRLPVVEELRAP